MRDIVFVWPPGQLTTDPRLAYNGISKTYVRQVFESLVDVDPVTAQVRPWLASVWSRPDPLTVELTIAPGRRFSDGVPLTADLVRNSFCDIMTDLAASTPLPSAVAALAGLSAVESHGDTVVFVAEGDLWRVPASGGRAQRLTTHAAPDSQPVISPASAIFLSAAASTVSIMSGFSFSIAQSAATFGRS